MKDRIDYLDGLRGLAILLVIGYHFFDHWANILPYGKQYADIYAFNLGWLGVQLFFVISGFVILLSLERCQGVVEFLYKRWLRLFPAMAIASAVIFASAWLLPERPFGQPVLSNLLPGLSFIDDRWWSVLLGQNITPLEGTFWSLYVEVKFYVIAALTFFFFNRYTVFYVILCAFGVAMLSWYGHMAFEIRALEILFSISNGFSLEHFGWFACGAAFYFYFDTGRTRWCVAGIGIAAVASLFLFDFKHWLAIAPFGLCVLFVGALKLRWLQHLLANRLLVFFGFISYPLYLIHENMAVALIVKLGKFAPGLPGWLYPIAPFLFVTLLAYCLAKYGEPYLRTRIRSAIVNRAKPMASTL